MKLPGNKTLFAILVSLFAFLFFTNGVIYLNADSFYYYHISKSILSHGSFISPERPEYYDYSGYAVVKLADNFVEVVSPGTSLILTPGLAAAQFLRAADAGVTNEYFLAQNGHTLAEAIAILLTAIIISLASIYLMFKTLLMWGYSRKISLVALVSSYFSSYAIWYVFLQPAYTHTYAIFAFSLVMWGLTKYYQYLEEKPLYLVGLGLGLAVLIRPIFAILAVVVGLTFLLRLKIRPLAKILATSIPAGIVWLIYNFVSYGSVFSIGYSEIRGETFQANSNIVNLLFSLERGWFVYSPVMLLAMVGIIAWVFRSKIVGGIMLITSVAIVGLYSFWPDWWGGYTFGQRFLLPLVPFAALGIAELFRIINKRFEKSSLRFAAKYFMFMIVMSLTLWSVATTLMYRFTPVTQLYSESAGELQAVDRYRITDIWQYQFDLITESRSVNEYFTKLYGGANGGESLIVYLLGWSDRVIRVEGGEQQISFHKLLPPIYQKKSREGQVTAYLVNEQTVYELTFSMESAEDLFAVECIEECATTSPGLNMRVTNDYPRTPDASQYDCYLLKGARKFCVRNSQGNKVKARKTDYSLQKMYSLP